MGIVKLAILDDWQSIGAPYFTKAVPDVQITTFSETLNPKNPADLEKLTKRLESFSIISTMRERTPFPAELLHKLPNLRLLLTTGMRNASLDLQACKALGIVVAGTDTRHNPPTENPKRAVPDSTTMHTWTLILALSRHIARDDAAVKTGGWQGQTLATTVAGKTLGLCGLGRLGSAVGRIAIQSWGMRVVCWSSSLTQDTADEKARSVGLEAGDFEVVSKEELFREADVLSVHYVLSPRSTGIIGQKELSVMKRSALLVNTSRGPLIDEAALLDVCKRGAITGVALDVFNLEPLPDDSQWRNTGWGQSGRSNVLLTPHTGYAEQEVFDCWYTENAENAKRWLNGQELTARLN